MEAYFRNGLKKIGLWAVVAVAVLLVIGVRSLRPESSEDALNVFDHAYCTGQALSGQMPGGAAVMVRLEEDTYVADTPGFASFDTEQMDVILKEDLQYAFSDFAPFLGNCQFHDCSHRTEPGCGIRQAVEAGNIEKTRYESYLRLYEQYSQIKPWEMK